MAFIFEEEDVVIFFLKNVNNDIMLKKKYIKRGDKKTLQKWIDCYMFEDRKNDDNCKIVYNDVQLKKKH
jgi:hypothetical protein